MTELGLNEYLAANPKVVGVLSAAVSREESRATDPNYLGWEWYDVRAYPATLMKLVVDGLIRVNFKSNSATCYLLGDLAATKQALAERQT